MPCPNEGQTCWAHAVGFLPRNYHIPNQGTQDAPGRAGEDRTARLCAIMHRVAGVCPRARFAIRPRGGAGSMLLCRAGSLHTQKTETRHICLAPAGYERSQCLVCAFDSICTRGGQGCPVRSPANYLHSLIHVCALVFSVVRHMTQYVGWRWWCHSETSRPGIPNFFSMSPMCLLRNKQTDKKRRK